MEDMTFYSAAAQVIPVLFLALTLDVNYGSRNYKDDTMQWVLLVVFMFGTLSLVAGEAAALRILDQGHSTNLLRGLVLAGMGAGGILLVCEVLLTRIIPDPLYKTQADAVVMVAGITSGAAVATVTAIALL